MSLLRSGIYYILRRIKDLLVRKHLRKNANKKHQASKAMKVAFIVFEPETWDKASPVYYELKNRENVVADLIVVPSFDKELRLIKNYGTELEFFKSIDPNCLRAYDQDGKLIDIKSLAYDYVFYQDPYNVHMPPQLRSSQVVKYSKICYIPYGYSGSNVFNAGNTNSSFFRNVYFGFLDVPEVRDILQSKFKKNIEKKYQNFMCIGYPSFEKFFNIPWDGTIRRILWAPRWSYDPQIGGSHFLEYKDAFVKLKTQYSQYAFAIRPHPMMFSNLVNNGLLSVEDKEKYISELHSRDIELSQSNALIDDVMASDLLITDYSSIIPMFFLTGKPIIYCKSDIELNEKYRILSRGMYMTDNWEEVQEAVGNILNGNDTLKQIRQEIIQQIYSEHKGATKRIVDLLVKDYSESVIQEDLK